MPAPRFHGLFVKRLEALTLDAIQITFAIAPDLRDTFAFAPGQFLTLRASIGGESVRRSYSICSTPALLNRAQEICIAIKRIEGGLFSTWASTRLQVGDEIDVMPPDGRFVVRKPDAAMRLAIAAGSGITPIFSIAAHTLAAEPSSRFTLIYGNQRSNTIMFADALHELKDSYPTRFQLIHILSRQATELSLHQGRIDAAKIEALTKLLIQAQDVDEAFVCGPEAMIEAAEVALQAAGVAKQSIHSERFAASSGAARARPLRPTALRNSAAALPYSAEIILDGKANAVALGADETVLDAALAAGLDLPYACKGGVCCTCRAKVIEGKVSMDKNYTLEQWEIDKGFVLTCQARCQTAKLVLSFDER